MRKSDGNWHQSKSGNWYNSEVCQGLAAHVEASCFHCGNDCLVRKHRSADTGKPVFCDSSCKMQWQSSWQDFSHLEKHRFKKGQKPHNFKGSHKHSAGYICESEDGKARLQHRLVVERFLGRKLKRTEVIHHVDGDKTNNSIENLQLMNQSDHIRVHQSEQRLNNPEGYAAKKRRASNIRWKKER